MDSSVSTSSMESSSAVGSSMLSSDIIRPPEHNHHGIKQIYKVIELPFPEHEGSIYFTTWSKCFVPSLLTWAGAQEDPFRVNSELYTAVPHIWKRIFPNITLMNDDLLTLVKVVSGTKYLCRNILIIL